MSIFTACYFQIKKKCYFNFCLNPAMSVIEFINTIDINSILNMPVKRPFVKQRIFNQSTSGLLDAKYSSS